jgi:hypothetical protein
MIFSSFFGVSLVSTTLLINPVKNQILLDGHCCCVDYLSKTWIFHWLREQGMPTVNLLRTHPLICAIPTLCFSEKVPPAAVLFAIFKCSMQQRNLRCIRIKLGWYIYIYLYIYTPDSNVGVFIWLLIITTLVLVLDPRLIFGWYTTDQHWYMHLKTSLMNTNMTFWVASPEVKLWKQNLRTLKVKPRFTQQGNSRSHSRSHTLHIGNGYNYETKGVNKGISIKHSYLDKAERKSSQCVFLDRNPPHELTEPQP